MLNFRDIFGSRFRSLFNFVFCFSQHLSVRIWWFAEPLIVLGCLRSRYSQIDQVMDIHMSFHETRCQNFGQKNENFHEKMKFPKSIQNQCFRVGVLVFCLFVFVRCFGSFVFLVSALRVFRAVTRLTVYRALSIWWFAEPPTVLSCLRSGYSQIDQVMNIHMSFCGTTVSYTHLRAHET